MPIIDDMRGVRGGVVYSAAGVNPVTARSWTKTVGLRLGTARRRGHPRYDVVDAVALVLMKDLTSNLGMEAATAARVVNMIRQRFTELIAAAVDDPRHSGQRPVQGYPYLALRLAKPFEQSRHRLLRNGSDLEAALASGGSSLVLICLPAVIGRAIHGMARVLDGAAATAGA